MDELTTPVARRDYWTTEKVTRGEGGGKLDADLSERSRGRGGGCGRVEEERRWR